MDRQDGTSLWQPYQAGIQLRSYQDRALQHFEAQRSVEARRAFYLVAPPGSGKTLLGLLMAESLGQAAVVLSPNAAIQQQWLSRLQEHWFALEDRVERVAPSPPAATEPGPSAQALISLTYQRVAVRDRNGDRHPNVLKLRALLRQRGVRTLILDECHHLSAEWGRAAEELAAALGAPFVVGLTATPVVQETGPMERLLGQPDHEISLPSVIRNGDLAPFQDLCHVVSPSRDEERDLQGSLASFEALWQDLDSHQEGRFSLRAWLDMLEVDPRDAAGEPYPDLISMLEAEPELITAWCRLRSASEQSLPLLLPPLPELYEAPTLTDRLLVAATFTARALLPEPSASDLARRSSEEIRRWGYEIKGGEVRRRAGEILERIAFSRQKLEAAVAILRTEMATMGDGLRALILTDYESPPEGSGKLSCVDVMARLTSTEDVDALDPILITGKSLLVDDDLWDRFETTCGALCRSHGWELKIQKDQEQGYWRLRGSGPDWETRVLVALVTEMLERGISRCLIGTRALLGEGWDCLRLNTLIDLTAVVSGVMVNQIQGRTLRRDPDNSVKVANNWDVLCLSELGEGDDLERLRTKHARLYGVTDDGQVERGLGHVHARFARVSVAELYAEREAVNRALHTRAQNRFDTRLRWRVGEPFEDAAFKVLSFAARKQRPPRRRDLPASPADAKGETTQLTLTPDQHRSRRRLSWLQLGAASALSAGLAVAAIAVGLPLALAAPLPLAAALLALSRRPAVATPEALLEAELDSLATLLARCLRGDGGVAADRGDDEEVARQAGAIEVRISKRDDGTLRVVWPRLDQNSSERLSLALAELLGPVAGQRYLIVEPLLEFDSGGLKSRLLAKPDRRERVFPVPRIFARRRAAERLLARWRADRNRGARLVHADSEEGRALCAAWLHCRALSGEASLQTLWR